MIVEDQSESVAFLKDPATHGTSAEVEVIETHISMVFLTGTHAYKLKRAVKLPYVDFSTLELRLGSCDKEVELNARTSPDLYRGVRRITRADDGTLSLDGDGDTVDAVVEMLRFEQEDLLDHMARAGKLTPALMAAVAEIVAQAHDAAPVVHAGSGRANMASVLDVNEAGFATSRFFPDDEMAPFNAAFRDALAEVGDTLDARERDGLVRRCHGDLHLRNICLFRGRPRLFDCIEFSDSLATVDVLYDAAFLLMDLWYRDLPDLGSLVLNRYLDETGDDGGFALFGFFMAVRAAVRAHVTATQIEESDDPAEGLARSARAHFDLARELLTPAEPRLVAIGGLSGSGKTTVAEALAPRLGTPPGARIFESDRIRKALFDVAPDTRLPDEAYRPEVSERVYATLGEKARTVLERGGMVVVDAVFDRPETRDAIARMAADAGVPFTGIWLDADPELLRARIAERPKGQSDATLDVLESQLDHETGTIDWQRIAAGKAPDDIVARILGTARI